MNFRVSLPSTDDLRRIGAISLSLTGLICILKGKGELCERIAQATQPVSVSQLATLPAGSSWSGQVCGMAEAGVTLHQEEAYLSSFPARKEILQESVYPFEIIDPLQQNPQGPKVFVVPENGSMSSVVISSKSLGRITLAQRASAVLEGHGVYVQGKATNNGSRITVQGELIQQGGPILIVNTFPIWASYFVGTLFVTAAAFLRPSDKKVLSLKENQQHFQVIREMLEGKVEQITVIVSTDGVDRIEIRDVLTFIKRNVALSVPPASIRINRNVFEVKFLAPRAETEPRNYPRIVQRWISRVSCSLIIFAFLDLLLTTASANPGWIDCPS